MNEEVQAEGQHEALPPAADQKKRNRRPHPGRQKLPADLPRVEKIVAYTPAQCVCDQCGGQTTVIGCEESEVLDVEPTKYFVQVTKREKRACKRCEEQGVAMLPRSKAGQASSYTLSLWKKLTRFLDYPQLELSHSLAENSMRPVATRRRNWIDTGSPQAGPRVAVILSVIESCRRLGIPVRDYLFGILPDLANRSIQTAASLTPAA